MHVNDSANKVWGREISNLAQKQRAAEKMAERLKQGDVVGVGSGSTSFITLKELAKKQREDKLDFNVITTSIEMEMVCKALGIPTTPLGSSRPDWSFDGADEVDADGNMIKGRGGAMLREKMLIASCPEVYIVVDRSKMVKRLGQNFAVPVEVHHEALDIVQKSLGKFKTVAKTLLRPAGGKDGPVITENGNLILDVTFSSIDSDTEHKLKQIVGVVESGLFIGYNPEVVINE